MGIDGVEVTIFGHTFRFMLWRDVVQYERERDGETEFVREQTHRLLPRRRTIYHRPPED